MTSDSPDLMIAKRLLDHAKLRGFQGHQFIEINPNGQWGWIEHQTGQPISRALATALKGTPPE